MKMPENARPRNDDWEEFGGTDGERQPPPSQNRTQIAQWQAGMIGRCGFCDLVVRVTDQVRRSNGTAGCPRCGGDFAFYREDQEIPNIQTLDLTRGWRPGSTGRCNFCGLVARVFEDAAKEDGSAGCEMCGRGVFEFTYGLPNTSFRAPGPKPTYDHEVGGRHYKLARRVPTEMITSILAALSGGRSVDEVINDPTFHERFNSDGFTRFVVEEIRKIENVYRWDNHQPLLYTEEEKTRLAAFKVLRVPLAGRAKIQFAGLHGPVERWVAPATLTGIQDGSIKLFFDGHYKIIESQATGEDPRYQMMRQVFGKCNALLERGLLRAWTPGGDEVPIQQGQWPQPPQGEGPAPEEPGHDEGG